MVVTTDAVGAGTVTSSQILNGYVVEVRLPSVGAEMVSSTADWTFTRRLDGGTILALANTAAPFQVFPARRLTNEAGGTTAYALGIGPVVQAGVPIDDYLVLTVAQATASKSGTLYVSVDGRAVY
jgi:hypothetical protein